MKQRITYILPSGQRAEKSDILLTNDSLTFTRADEAATEWRLTLGWQDLPVEIQSMLDHCHELHLRWTSTADFHRRVPFVSQLPAGLHVFFTPRLSVQSAPICDLIRHSLPNQPIKCDSISDTFTKPPVLSERFAASSTYQYYHNTNITPKFGEILLEKLCTASPPGLHDCDHLLDQLRIADYLDVDFDAISHAVIFTAYWHAPSATTKLPPRAIRKPISTSVIEVGILHAETAKDAEHISLGGHLTVIGETDHPSITLFSFPSRHHPHDATYTAAFLSPTGLHPKLTLALPRQHLAPPKPACALHAYWTLPSALFIDRYQLSDPLFLASNNLKKLHSLAGEDDLEAPDWVVKAWGSAALLELAVPPAHQSKSSKSGDWTVTIPTHLRYLASTKSSTSSSYQSLDIPYPNVFWACEAEEGLKMATNPFDRVNIGYDGLFGAKTMFYHLSPASSMVGRLEVPVLNAEEAGYVGLGTLGVVLLGFGWVCWQLFAGSGGREKEKGS